LWPRRVVRWLADRFVNAQIDNQKARNDYISKNIRELDKQVEEIKDLQRKRNQLIDRMRVIQELQGNRPIIVRVLDQLVRTVPDGVFYTSVTAGRSRTASSTASPSPTTASPA
jgi:type IV pilus assembly protein PilN